MSESRQTLSLLCYYYYLKKKNTQTEVKLSGNFCFVFDSFLKTNFISNFKTIVILPIPYLDSTTYENNSLFLYFCFVVIVIIMMMMFNTIFINGKIRNNSNKSLTCNKNREEKEKISIFEMLFILLFHICFCSRIHLIRPK